MSRFEFEADSDDPLAELQSVLRVMDSDAAERATLTIETSPDTSDAVDGADAPDESITAYDDADDDGGRGSVRAEKADGTGYEPLTQEGSITFEILVALAEHGPATNPGLTEHVEYSLDQVVTATSALDRRYGYAEPMTRRKPFEYRLTDRGWDRIDDADIDVRRGDGGDDE